MENCDKFRFDEKMFHVKHFCKIILLMALILFYKSENVYASAKNYTVDLDSSSSPVIFYVIPDNQSLKKYLCIVGFRNNANSVNITINNGYITFSNYENLGYTYYKYSNSTPESPVYSGNISFYADRYYDDTFFSVYTDNNTIFVVKGKEYINFNGEILDSNSGKTWYSKLWDGFSNMFTNAGTWLQGQVNNIGTIVSNWWNSIRSGSHGGSHTFGNKYLYATPLPSEQEVINFPTATPTQRPTPTPRPTQIPVSTVIQDDGNGNSMIMYVYTNPEGTPTASPYNPNVINNYYSDDDLTNTNTNTNIYNDNSINVKDGSDINWQDIIGYDKDGNEVHFNIADLDTNTDLFTVPLEETAEDVSTAVGGFSALPDNILIIIGCIACIPLIAGIIGRLLK